MNINTSPTKIDKILERGFISTILPSKKELRSRLMSGDQLRVYLGIDPTSTSLHIGHAENILLLEDFRSLGHRVVLLMGDFTAKIGDPSDQPSTRKILSDKEIEKNINVIKDQLAPILNFKDKKNPAKIDYNSRWLAKLSFEKILKIASKFTVQQMIERDMFEHRIKSKNPLYLHEFFYPLMQGYDSVALDTDIEIGGTDQIFNMLAGRTLLNRQKDITGKNPKNKFVIANQLIEDPNTKELMSMSKGTGVLLSSSPDKMFGEVMAQSDNIIETLFINTTRVPIVKIKEMVKKSKSGGKTMRDFKIKLAEETVKIYYGKDRALGAKKNFINIFSKRKLPGSTETRKHSQSKDSLLNVLTDKPDPLIKSKTETRRLIKDGAIDVNGETLRDPQEKITLPATIRIGKHRFVKIAH